MRIQTTRKLDLIDLERLLELTQSEAWQSILDRIHHEQAVMTEELTLAMTWEQTVRLQGRIEGTRDVLAIPQILINEARTKGRTK